MNISLIGGAGFVGTRLVLSAGSKHKFTIVDKVRSTDYPELMHLADVRDPESLSRVLEGSDTVVLLAAEHRDDISPVSRYYDVNVEGTRNVLAEMDRLGLRRLVFTSTVAIYGMNHDTPPAETDSAAPFNHYGKSKYEAESVIREWVGKGDGRSALVIRPTVIFGERNRGNVFNLLKQINDGKFLMIGSGQNRKSMAYVGNIAAFILHMIERGFSGFEAYNYADKPDLDMNSLVAEVYRFKGQSPPRLRLPFLCGFAVGLVFDGLSKVSGRNFPISSIRVKKFCANTIFNAAKLAETGFERPFSLEEGLQRTLRCEFGGEVSLEGVKAGE